MRQRGPGVVAFPLVLILSAACSPEGRPDGWAGTVDTLAGGAVRVHNPKAGIWDSASAWEVEETLRLGSVEGSGPEVFGDVRGVALDAYRRVYVLDRTRHAVQVFAPSGEHVRTLGGRGQGPGELSRAFGLAFGPDERLWIADVGNTRYTVYDTAGSYRNSYPRRLSGHSVPWPGKFTSDGLLYDLTLEVREADFRNVLVGYRVRGEELQRVDTTWVPPDPIPTERQQVRIQREGGTTAFGVPYAPRLEWWLGPAGHLWFGRSDRYRIVQRTLAGDTLRVVEREYEPVPVGDDDPRVEQFREQMEKRNIPVDGSRVPDERPAFESLRTGDRGYLWVEVHRRSEAEAMPVDVFDPEGRYLGSLALPFSSLSRTVLRGDRMCGTATGELDVERVVCVRIRR